MLSDEKIKAEIKEEIKKAEIKKAEIKEVVKKVNDLFRERNYFKTIMDGYSHVSEEEVKSKYDGGNPKCEDEKDFMYPTVFEYDESWGIGKKDKDRATFIYDSVEVKRELPSPDKFSEAEYSDFKHLIDYKNQTGPKFFEDYKFDYVDVDVRYKTLQLYYRDSEDSLLRLSGDMLFHFDQLINHVADKKDALDRLKNPSLQPLINTFIKASALPGNYIFWRVVGQEGGVNTTRSSEALCDRFDLALVALREWFTDGYDASHAYGKKGYTLLAAFSKEADAGYPFFLNKEESGWKDFVNFFELKGSFVDDDYRVYNQVSNPFEEEMEVFPDKNKDWDGKLKKSWSDPKHDEGIPPEIENYLINGIKTIIKRTERLNEILHRA